MSEDITLVEWLFLGSPWQWVLLMTAVPVALGLIGGIASWVASIFKKNETEK